MPTTASTVTVEREALIEAIATLCAAQDVFANICYRVGLNRVAHDECINLVDHAGVYFDGFAAQLCRRLIGLDDWDDDNPSDDQVAIQARRDEISAGAPG
jgi:hypothetical protein